MARASFSQHTYYKSEVFFVSSDIDVRYYMDLRVNSEYGLHNGDIARRRSTPARPHRAPRGVRRTKGFDN